ncbi:hypothetical protein ABZ599_39245 [Streptomyces misionensis]|uniref:hypothetical protein n=1 Tax=Streptomyces misionensis TaxID=67331 RepID=UPI0033C115B2
MRAAEAEGNKGGRVTGAAAARSSRRRRPPSYAAYLGGQSVTTLARNHRVSRGAITDLMPDHTASEEDTPASELPISAIPAVHHQFLARCQPCERGHGNPGTA